ncbi:sugar ABC transporter permease [Halobacteriales archaeon QS_4_69_31]|jgi:ABC-type sugar transport system permease subunit|nr:MAG: sugar ABC transporter permease [Halobacteriales archaeon QS_4_69_31]
MSYQSDEQIRERYGLEERTITDRLRENWVGYLFIFPTFLMFSLLFYYPIVRGVYLTFTDTKLGLSGQFIGLDNYYWLLTNDLFLFAFGWTLVFVFGVTGLQLVLGGLAALLLSELSNYRRWISAVVMSPYFSAPLAGGVIWLWFLDSSFGFLPRVFADLGLVAPGFLSEGLWPYVSLIVAQTWHDYGYAAIIYAAALINIPSDQYEAAALAGAGRLRRFRDVTLPHLITPTIIILALRTAYNVAEFAQPFELTGGGPGTRTMLLSILTYRVAYVNNSFGRGYTVGMAMIVISMTAAVFYVTVIKGEEELYV